MTYFVKRMWSCIFKQLFWSALIVAALMIVKKWLSFGERDTESFLLIIGLFFVNVVCLFAILRPSLQRNQQIFTTAVTNVVAVLIFNLIVIFFVSPAGFVGSPYFFCLLLLMSLFAYIFNNILWERRERAMNSSLLDITLQIVVTTGAMVIFFSFI